MNALLRTLCLGLVLLLQLAGRAGAADRSADVAYIPVDDGNTLMATAVFVPAGHGPFPVVVYSHGRSATDLDRKATRFPDARGHVRYWLGKGFAVVAPIRPGYGETGGADNEDSGLRYDLFGNCWGEPRFARAAGAAADAVQATLIWVREQPWADARRVVLVGASMGGLASIASAAATPDGVVAYINFSGGTGGNGKRAPEHSCGLETMETAMSAYGATTRIPGLWLYAQNDLYWGAEWPRAWYRAYAAGGSPTEFVMTEPLPAADGHQLLARGSRLWVRHVDQFLERLGF